MGFLRKIFSRTETPPPDRATTAPLTPELVPDDIPGEGRRHLQIGVGHVGTGRKNGPRTDAHMIMLGGYDGNDMLPDYGILSLAVGQADFSMSDQASTTAVRTALRSVTRGTYLQVLELEPLGDLPSLHTLMQTCFEEANWALKAVAEEGATCLTVTLILGEQVVVGHVGNSRAYLWHNQEIKRLTEDHPLPSGGEEVTPAGTVFAEEKRTQSSLKLLGPADELEVDITSHEISAGDVLLLASPGLWKALPDEVIAGAFQGYPDAHRCAEALVAAAREISREKEITALVARIPGN